MLSILIPIYNDPVVQLVEDLHRQCVQEKIDFEVLCLDDGSRSDIRRQNAPLARLSQVYYRELPQNLGRARIRNRLAAGAKYPYLLFIDGDAAVVKPDYLQHYLRLLAPGRVIYGGRVYDAHPPEELTFRLHWRYGRQREALPVAARAAHPHRTFMTNNFVVPQTVFQRVRFDESIRRYGYEDTLYALSLKDAGIDILHTDNPLLHLGLETRETFLRKVDDALDNLRELAPRHPELDTRLLVVVRQLKKKNMLRLIRTISPFLQPLCKSLLRMKGMPLRILDLYKIFYFTGNKKR